MSESLTKQSAPQEIELAGRHFRYAELLNEALTMPGRLSDTYSRFYNYSLLNQLLLHLQGVDGPVATYKKWQAMDRQVIKGSKAKSILRPIIINEKNEQDEEVRRVKGFKLVKCLFTASETTGPPLPEVEPSVWDEERALGALAITRVPFTELDGNSQGYSYGNNVAINPVAKYPRKTLMHELGHVVLGHTQPDNHQEYASHRGIAEFQAESVAYLSMHELGLDEHFNASESRAYIQTWLQGDTPDDRSIRQVFAATTRVLEAGRGDER